MSEGKLSAKQTEILEYIKSETVSRGYPPSVREICDAVHLKSTSSVHAHLERLESAGYIRRDPTKPRAIEILDADFRLTHRELVQIPVIGQVAAGEPLLAEEHITDYFPLPAELAPNAECFMLRVKGESMINAGICDGDRVFVRSQDTAQDGDIIVALLGEGATVKTFYREKDHIRLQPENDTMDPILVSSDLRILGKVFGVIRLF